MSHQVALTIALAFAAGMIVQCLARSLQVPAIILLLAAGVLLGPEGLGWVQPDTLGGGLFILVDFAVAIILFEGGLNLKLDRLRRERRVIRQLVTWGALVTLVGGTLAARLWLSWPWTIAMLFGSLVVVTGPTVVGPLVRDLRLHTRLQTVLEAEGVLIDPIGALLAALVLQVTLASDAIGMVSGLWTMGARLAVGVLCGIGGGLAIAASLRLPSLVHGLENALTLALVVLLFHLSDLIMAPSGLLAVTIAGLVVGNLKSPVDEDLREFKDQLTVLMIGAVFVLLAAGVSLADARALGWAGVGVLATLVVVVRPACVWLSVSGAGISGREQLFLSAIAPRGIVAAAIASLTAGAVGGDAEPLGVALRAMVFLVIAGTVIQAGLTAWPLAALLGLRLPARDRIAIAGAEGLGLALARELRDAGQSVVLIDADPQRCRAAEADGFTVVFGDALQERTLRRVPIEHVGTAIGATFNDNLNSQFARLARHTFRVAHGLVAVDSLNGDRPPEHVARHGADVLFDGAHDQERWDVRLRQGDVEIVSAAWQQPPPPASADTTASAVLRRTTPQELFVVLALERGGRVLPMALSRAPKPGERARIALHRKEREAAVALMASNGWTVVST